MSTPKKLAGFTLIEILVVVALIAILTAITFIAINPAKNFQDTRNAQRSADVTQILNAVTQYTSEQGHALGDLTNTNGLAIPVCPSVVEVGPAVSPAAYVALEDDLVDGYIVGIPYDPSLTAAQAASDGYGYTICHTAGGRVEVSAPNAENGKTISVKR